MIKTIDIEAVYDAMSQRLYNTSLRIVGCRSDAEEIMHDSLLEYWKCSRKEEILDLKKWLTSICVRKSIDRLRKQRRFKDFLEKYEDPVLDEGVEDNASYDIESILKALHTLPDNYRAVLSLHLFEGYDYQEMSQITGMNENTIRSLYMRGRQKLAEAIRKKKS